MPSNDDDFNEATQAMILDNPDDVASGIIKVQFKSNMEFFNIFNNLFVKHDDEGNIRYIFHTKTSDTKKIFTVSNTLFELLGEGIYNDEFASFIDEENVKNIVNGDIFIKKSRVFHYWHTNSVYKFDLGYKKLEDEELRLTITREKPISIDRKRRNKGTILDLIPIDFKKLLLKEPNSKNIKKEHNTVTFIDYHYILEIPVIDIFDKITLKIFSEKRKIKSDITVNVFLSSTNKSSTIHIDKVIRKIVKIYGKDEFDEGDLKSYEIDTINSGFWTGRTWTFNINHELQSIADEGGKYCVMIRIDDESTGLELSILNIGYLIEV